MEQDIKRLEDYIYNKKETMKEQLVKAIEHIIKAYKEKDKDNNDLRRLYRRTAVKLRENGKEELADYFLAQINEVPTFVVDDDIDYYTEYYKLKEENEDLKNLANKKQWISPCYVAQNYIPVSLVEEKIEELKKEEQELQNSISDEEREEYSDANISFELMDIEIRRSVLQKLLEKVDD